MYRTCAIGTLAALTLPTAALEPRSSTVKGIGVDVDLEASENPKVAACWTLIAGDLKNAITKLATRQSADDGVEVKIDRQRVERSGGFDAAMGNADAAHGHRPRVLPAGAFRSGKTRQQ